MSKFYAKDLIKLAKGELGYEEKKSNKDLEYKHKNVGDNNFTKYATIFNTNGVFWCACFISWVAYTLVKGDKEALKKLMNGSISMECEVLRQQDIKAKRYDGKPKLGARVYFKGTRHSGANHIGWVVDVDGNKFTTVEGNSSTSEYTDNGGCVATHTYFVGDNKILGFGYPQYDEVPKTINVKTTAKCNLYKKANTTQGKIESLVKGTNVEFIADNKDGWSKVSHVGKVGYVKNSCLDKSGLSGYRIGKVKTVAKIRVSNSIKAKSVGTAKVLQEFKVVSVGKYWTCVKYKKKDRFISTKKIVVSK